MYLCVHENEKKKTEKDFCFKFEIFPTPKPVETSDKGPLVWACVWAEASAFDYEG